jgi:L,D-transpeptidase catalytic domain
VAPQRDRRLRIFVGVLGLFMAPMLLALAPAQASATLGAGPIAETVGRLKPGQYLWSPGVAPAGPMLMVINLKTQRGVVYRNGIPIGITTVSSGRRGHETPPGIYTVLQKRADHRSSLYDAAPMQFMQRLTWDGIALHGGVLPGYPASHGCIRLPEGFARRLFAETRIGMLVVIASLARMPTMAVTDAAPLMTDASARRFEVRPTVQGTGVLSIIISVTDREVRVIRAGHEIGAARIDIRGDVQSPAAFQLQPEGKWLRVLLPGQTDEVSMTINTDAIEVDDAFRQRILSMAAPGTTIIVTKDSLHPELSTMSALIGSEPDE